MRSSRLMLGILMLLALACSQMVPQFSVTTNVVGSTTSYKLSYLSTNNLTSATTFNVNFNQSYIRIADGPNNCTIRLGGVAVSTPSCNCTNRVCFFRPMVSSDVKTIDI